MKLRNKKTGEVKEFNEIFLTKTVKETNTATSEYVERSYCKIAELIADWEDYKPAESLIKDEKIRKAVRAWAEACGVEEYVSVSDLSPAFTRFYTNEYEIDIKTENSLCLSEREYYTIAELCGEEEE